MPKTNGPVLARVAEVASAQRGLVSAAQLAEAGLARTSVRHRARQGGPWRRVLPATYLLSHTPLSDEQSHMAAMLYVGVPAAFTGLTALRAHGVRAALRAGSDDIHVLVPHTRTRASVAFVIVERTRYWPDTVLVRGMPTVPVARAAIDASRRMDRRSDIRGVLSEVVQRRLASLDELRIELRTSQRRRTALARETVEALALGPASVPEIELHERWTRESLPAALWNADLFKSTGEFVARPDVYLPDTGIVLEVDSREFHFSPSDWEHTMRRHSRMTAFGLIVLHVTPHRLRTDWPAVVREIREAVASRGGLPGPDIVARHGSGRRW